jgi:hypothetical protein
VRTGFSLLLARAVAVLPRCWEEERKGALGRAAGCRGVLHAAAGDAGLVPTRVVVAQRAMWVCGAGCPGVCGVAGESRCAGVCESVGSRNEAGCGVSRGACTELRRTALISHCSHTVSAVVRNNVVCVYSHHLQVCTVLCPQQQQDQNHVQQKSSDLSSIISRFSSRSSRPRPSTAVLLLVTALLAVPLARQHHQQTTADTGAAAGQEQRALLSQGL